MHHAGDHTCDLDDLNDLRRALLERDLLLGRIRKELTLAERWVASVIAHTTELVASAENAQSTLLDAARLVPAELELGTEIDDLQYLLGDQ